MSFLIRLSKPLQIIDRRFIVTNRYLKELTKLRPLIDQCHNILRGQKFSDYNKNKWDKMTLFLLIWGTQKSMAFKDRRVTISLYDMGLVLWSWTFFKRNGNTVCPSSLVHFYGVSYNIKMDQTSWTFSQLRTNGNSILLTLNLILSFNCNLSIIH